MADPKSLGDALMGYGRDFLQSASNSAASNVSAPVDGLAWALRKAGVPIPAKPFMGSDWMTGKGLTPPMAHSPVSVLGETASMLAPFGAAAKAPEIARGLLKMGENAMVPRTMNNQAGAVVWHGSPHKFDAFDAGKIGTGEGNQSYGHGLYLADSKEVAGGYQSKLTDDAFKYKAMNEAKSRLHEKLAKRFEDADPLRAAALRSEVASLGEPGGSMYKVDLPDEHIAKMLDWDKPFNQQSTYIQDAIKPHMDSWAGKMQQYNPSAVSAYQSGSLNGRLINGAFGDGSAESSASALKDLGVTGIRYLDGGSRNSAVGTSNYVVFPGNESMLNILERNGQAIK